MEDDAECSAAEEPSMEPRQGDYLPEVRKLPILDARGEPSFVSAPEGAIIITQSCDLARKGNTHVHLSPVVTLSGGNAFLARAGRMPRFAPIPELEKLLGPDHFVDLDMICSVEHALLEKTKCVRVIIDEQSRHKFGQRVGRVNSRPALPDELAPVIRRFKKLVWGNAGKSSSFGRVLDRLAYLRLGGWNSPPPGDLTVLFVLKDGWLPPLPAAPTGSMTPASSVGWKPQTVAELADMILRLDKGDSRLWELWISLSEAITDILCEELPPTVASITAEVLDYNEFLVSQYQDSSSVDFDHLSEPVDDGT